MRSWRRSLEKWHDKYLMKSIGDAEAPDGIRSDEEFRRGTIRTSHADDAHVGRRNDHRRRRHGVRYLGNVGGECVGTGGAVIACSQHQLALLGAPIGYGYDGRLRYRRSVCAVGMMKETSEKIRECNEHQHDATQNMLRSHRIRSCDFTSHVLRITKRSREAKYKSNLSTSSDLQISAIACCDHASSHLKFDSLRDIRSWAVSTSICIVVFETISDDLRSHASHCRRSS